MEMDADGLETEIMRHRLYWAQTNPTTAQPVDPMPKMQTVVLCPPHLQRQPEVQQPQPPPPPQQQQQGGFGQQQHVEQAVSVLELGALLQEELRQIQGNALRVL